MLISRIADYIRSHGVAYTLRRAGEKAQERIFHRYHRFYLRHCVDEETLRSQRAHQPRAGRISVVIPVYNTQPDMLRALAESLLRQTYADWEACLYDGCSTHPDTRRILTSIAGLDNRFRIAFGETNEGISGNTNQAINMASGSYCALCDHDDLLAPDALWHIARAIEATHAKLLYTDEDKLTEDGRWHIDPHLKPDFGPDTLRSGNYICHLMVIQTELLRQVGGLRTAFDGSQDHDLALRCTELAQRVVHIPHILYHWRTVGASMSHQRLKLCQDAACRAVMEQMTRMGYPGEAVMERGVMRLRYRVPEQPTVRVLCYGGEPTVRLNAAMQPVSLETNAINAAVSQAAEDFILLMDAALTPQLPDFLSEMLMYAQRDDVGAVAPLVLDASGRTILSAGLAIMQDGRVCPRHAGQPYAGGGLWAQALTSHNIAAASLHCLMFRRDHFVPFTGVMDETASARWCMQLTKRGLRHVYTPHAIALTSSRLHPLPEARLPSPAYDPCINPAYTVGAHADFNLYQGANSHAAD